MCAFYRMWAGWCWEFPGISESNFWWEYHKWMIDKSIIDQLDNRT